MRLRTPCQTPRLLLLALVAVVVGTPGPTRSVRAQVATPAAAGVVAEDYLPEAEILGDGWSSPRSFETYSENLVYAGRITRLYYGPAGARIGVTAQISRPGSEAMAQAAREIGDAYEQVRTTYGADDTTSDLPATTPLPGCPEVRHSEGREDAWNVRVGITLCTVDETTAILVVASGQIHGVNGILAADEIASLAARTPG
jgi:hypothetical protein